MDLATPILTQGVLGVAVVALAIVVVRLYNKIESLQKEKAEILEAWRQEGNTKYADSLRIIQGNSENILFMAEKIEAAKKAKR